MRRTLAWMTGIGIVAIVAAVGIGLIEGARTEVSASAVLIGAPTSIEGFARATEPLAWEFPRNFGAHPDYQTEWWYYTGNLTADDGRRFGYQFTIFRRAIAPEDASSAASEWRTSQIYMAHFAISDLDGGRFFHDERFSRASAGLAGAEVAPRLRIWLEDWQIVAANDDATERHLRATGDDFALDVRVVQTKPPALQGDRGLSQKSSDAGNASHYYSLSRLLTEGTITLGDQVFQVSGASWMDHEFSTSALGGGALGWDWFALQFEDGREAMIGQIRQTEGGRDPNFGGVFIFEDGSTVYLPSESFTITPTSTWTSPHSGAVYPAAWDVTIAIPDGDTYRLTIESQMPDQELTGGGIAYWEGAIAIRGDLTGVGYAELTGYADSMTGRF